MRLEPLHRRHALEVEQVRARPDDRHEAHDELLADRVDRRVRHLGEVLLEVGEQQLRPVGQRRDRRVVAHRADRLLAGGAHRRHQDLEVFLGVAEGLLAIEQSEVRQRRPRLGRRQLLEQDQRVHQPFLVGMAARELRLDLLVGNEAAFLEVDEQHLAGLQAPLGDDVALRDRQHAHFRGHDDAVVAGDEIARRPQAVAVERRADLAAVGEGDRRRAVPRLHQAGVVLVEGAPLLVHQRIAGPRLRDHHHHRMGERIAALHQELERVVEAGGVRLALVGDRPQLADVVAVIGRARRGLPRRHPVAVAAQRVDLAVVGDHAIGMRQRPGREGVGREALVHQRERADEIRLVQVGIVGAELVGEEHALVDHGAARHRDRVIAEGAPLAHGVEAARYGLAQDVEAALELVLGDLASALADEDLLVHRLGRLDRLAERRIVGRHVAPAEELHAFGGDLLGVDLPDFLPPVFLRRHEQHADGVCAGSRQREAELRRLPGEERVGNLHQDAGAVAGARVGADRAAMLEIDEDRERILDDLVGLAPLDVGDEADAAGILVERGIVEAARLRHARIGGVAARRHGRRFGMVAASGIALPDAFAESAMLVEGSCRVHPLPPHSSGRRHLPTRRACDRAHRRCGPHAYHVKLTASSPAVFLRRAACRGSCDANHRRPPRPKANASQTRNNLRRIGTAMLS